MSRDKEITCHRSSPACITQVKVRICFSDHQNCSSHIGRALLHIPSAKTAVLSSVISPLTTPEAEIPKSHSVDANRVSVSFTHQQAASMCTQTGYRPARVARARSSFQERYLTFLEESGPFPPRTLRLSHSQMLVPVHHFPPSSSVNTDHMVVERTVPTPRVLSHPPNRMRPMLAKFESSVVGLRDVAMNDVVRAQNGTRGPQLSTRRFGRVPGLEAGQVSLQFKTYLSPRSEPLIFVCASAGPR